MDKRKTAFLAFFTDLAVSLWSYFKLSNYGEFTKAITPYKTSPDFQLQLYQVLLQSLTFSLLLFLTFHIVVYWQYSKGKKLALKYVRVYMLLASLSCILMVFSQLWIAVIPFLVYSWLYLAAKKAVAELKG